MEKRESSLKSHEEIMELFEELEAIEQRLRIQGTLEVPEEETLPPQEDLDKKPVEIVPTVPPVAKRWSVSKRERHPKHGNPLFRRQKLFDIEEIGPESEIPAIVSPQSTFVLRLNDEGTLYGFDQPKPKPEPLHLSLPHRKKEAKEGEAPAGSGRFGRLRSLFSRKKASSETGSSGLSKILGRLKGLGRRRSKE